MAGVRASAAAEVGTASRDPVTESSATFYATVSGVSFVLLGLWWVVVQGRPSWRTDLGRRRMAYVISLHFLLPGVMSIVALAAPDQTYIWRISFTLAGIFGVVAVLSIIRILREEHDCPRVVRLFQWVVLPIYVVVTALAVSPELVKTLGLSLTPIQAESLLLSVILFFGVQSAWILMVEPQRTFPDPGAGERSS